MKRIDGKREGEDMASVEISLQGGMRFEAVGEDGIPVMLDASPEHHGTGAGFRPLELLLVGLGACTAMDVLSILRKKRQDVTAYRVLVSAQQANDHPKVFTDIRLRHVLQGNNLSQDAVARAIELSENKYCPAFAMLQQGASISSSFEVHPSAPLD